MAEEKAILELPEMKNKDFMLLNQISQKTELSCLTQI